MIRRIAQVVVVCIGLTGCPSTGTGTEPNWPLIAQEMQLGAADLRDVALLLDDVATAATLVELADVLDLASASIGDGGDALDMIDSALGLANQLVEKLPEDAQDEARAAILIVRAGLRRARAYSGGTE